MQETAALLADCGVTWLHNGFVTLQRGGDSLLLAGIDDPNGYADQKTPQQVAGRSGTPPRKASGCCWPTGTTCLNRNTPPWGRI